MRNMRPPRTISREEERRQRQEAARAFLAEHHIHTAEVLMLLKVVRDVSEYEPRYSDEGDLTRRWVRRGGDRVKDVARRAVLSGLLDRIDGEHVTDETVHQAAFAPGLTRSARLDRVWTLLTDVEESRS